MITDARAAQRPMKLPKVLPSNPNAALQITPMGEWIIEDGSIADAMGTVARALTLKGFQPNASKQEWARLDVAARKTMASDLTRARQEWSFPIHLTPEEQKELRARLPTPTRFRGLGTIWRGNAPNLFVGRPTCAQLKPGDRIQAGQWRNAFSDPRFCSGLACSKVLGQAVRNAKNEDVTVQLTIIRAESQELEKTRKVRCRIKRQK